MDIATRTDEGPVDQITLDDDGNLGVRGHVYANVARLKNASAPMGGGAVAALGKLRVEVVTRRDGTTQVALLGKVPISISGNGANSMDETTSLVITMAAVNQLAAEVRDLKSQLAALKR